MMAFVAANATSVLKAPEAVAFAATKPRGVYNVKVFGKGVDSTVLSHNVSAGPRNPSGVTLCGAKPGRRGRPRSNAGGVES